MKFTIKLLHASLLTIFVLCSLSATAEYTCESDCFIVGENEEDQVDISTINPSEFGGCVKVVGTLMINQNTTLWGANFIMDEGSSIVVQEGVVASLIYCNFFGCDYLWKGIIVEGGASLYTFYCNIQDANTATFLEDESYLYADKNVYENNYIGIASGLPTDISATQKELDGLIVGCDFTSTDDLLLPYPGHAYDPSWPSSASIPYDISYCGVYLRNSSGLNVGVASAVAADRNSFTYLRNGVVSFGSVVNIRGCDISSLVGTIAGEGNPLLHQNLTNTGIWLYRSVASVQYCDLEYVQDGVVSHQGWADISFNTIEPNLYSETSRIISRGVFFGSSGADVSVHHNDIENAGVGIFLDGGFTGEISISDNTIEVSEEDVVSIGIDMLDWKSYGDNPGEVLAILLQYITQSIAKE